MAHGLQTVALTLVVGANYFLDTIEGETENYSHKYAGKKLNY